MRTNRKSILRIGRLAPALVLTAAVVTGGLWAASGGRAAAAVGWDVPHLVGQIEAAEASMGLIDERLASFEARKSVKESLVVELAEGRLSLGEAADHFRRLQASEEGFWLHVRATYPDATDEERLYRNVIDYTRTLLRGRPGSEALLGRLQRELRAEFDNRNGDSA